MIVLGPLGDVRGFPSGLGQLDEILGGGWPRGALVQVFGPPGTLKTFLALRAIAECQRAGGTAAFVDVGHGFDLSYAQALGIRVDDLLIAQPDGLEEVIAIAETLARSGAVDLIVVDDLGVVSTSMDMDGLAIPDRLMSQFCRKVTAICARNNTTILFTETSETGGSTGNALKFYTSIRLGCCNLEEGTRLKTVKNKLSPPFRSTVISAPRASE